MPGDAGRNVVHMHLRRRCWAVVPIILGLSLSMIPRTMAGQREMPMVRIAELEIDPSRLSEYRAAVQEEIQDAVHHEPGVLAIYCVTLKDQPASFRLLEMYADAAAYQAHIAGPFFQKYAERTRGMILAKRLIETDPVQLSFKRS